MSILFGKIGLYLGLLAVCLIALAIVSRNWSCRAHRDPQPIRRGPYDVSEVVTGATLLVDAGFRGRRWEVLLTGIAAPAAGEPLAEDSRAYLERLAGPEVWIEFDPALLRPHQVEGIVYGYSGEHLQVAQLRAGLARTTPAGDLIAPYRAAQAEAKKAHRGIWGVQNPLVAGALAKIEDPLTRARIETQLMGSAARGMDRTLGKAAGYGKLTARQEMQALPNAPNPGWLLSVRSFFAGHSDEDVAAWQRQRQYQAQLDRRQDEIAEMRGKAQAITAGRGLLSPEEMFKAQLRDVREMVQAGQLSDTERARMASLAVDQMVAAGSQWSFAPAGLTVDPLRVEASP